MYDQNLHQKGKTYSAIADKSIAKQWTCSDPSRSLTTGDWKDYVLGAA